MYMLASGAKQREGKDNRSQRWAEVAKWHRHFVGCSSFGICAPSSYQRISLEFGSQLDEKISFTAQIFIWF